MNDETIRLYHELWAEFFPRETFFVEDTRLSLANLLFDFFHSAQGREAFPQLGPQSALLSRRGTLPLDVQQLRKHLPFDDVEAVLTQKPQEILACLSLALSRLANTFTPYLSPALCIHASVHSLSCLTGFGEVKSAQVGQLVQVEGHVVRVSGARPLLLSALFHCAKCGQSTYFAFEDGMFAMPTMCATKKCYNKYLEFDRNSVRTTDVQQIKLTEIDELLDNPSSTGNNTDSSPLNPTIPHTARVPRTLTVEVRAELVHAGIVAGDRVCVCGTVKAMPLELSRSRGLGSSAGKGASGANTHTRESGLHQLYVLANSVTCVVQRERSRERRSSSTQSHNNNNKKRAREGEKGEGHSSQPIGLITPSTQSHSLLQNIRVSEFSSEELRLIRSIALSPHCLAVLVQSLCESIYGHETVKLGLLLGIFGGCDVTSHNTTTQQHSHRSESDFMMHSHKAVRVRENIHVLIVGDPGLGKSQLLRSAAHIAPRSVYVCGNTSTAAGLTVSLTRDAHTNSGGGSSYSIEAGALVLADQGVCCVDELDKTQCDPHALLEAMEQQSVSVAKAGVVTSLRSRCAVLAAANPVGGHYQRKKTVGENLKMNSALLSRFDLVFILLDQPDTDRDTLIGEHVLGVSYSSVTDTHTDTHESNAFDPEAEAQKTLTQRLRARVRVLLSRLRQGQLRLLTATEMKRYVEYAQRYVRPRLTKEAARHLQKTYLSLRAEGLGEGRDSIPVTTRHLESLIRLSQARARMELREEVTESDAQDVTQLLRESLLDALTGEGGAMIDCSKRGGQSVLKQVKALVTVLQRESKARQSQLFHKNDIEAFSLRLRLTRDVDDLIDVMNTEGYLLKKGPKLFQLQSA